MALRTSQVKSPEYAGRDVTVRGWVYRLRRQKENAFVLVRDDRGGVIQCIFPADKVAGLPPCRPRASLQRVVPPHREGREHRGREGEPGEGGHAEFGGGGFAELLIDGFSFGLALCPLE